MTADTQIITGDALPLDAEDGEELVPETLRLGALGFLAGPAAGEFVGAAADFVPGKRHANGQGNMNAEC